MATIVLVQQLLIWGPEFVEDFLLNGEITNEKVSTGMLAFGIFMIVVGFTKYEQKRWIFKNTKNFYDYALLIRIIFHTLHLSGIGILEKKFT